jgi:hypothetical protein
MLSETFSEFKRNIKVSMNLVSYLMMMMMMIIIIIIIIIIFREFRVMTIRVQ